MKTAGILAVVGLFLVGVLGARAAEYYVAPYNEGASSPYTSWETAGTNIIDVVNVAMTDGSTPIIVWVSNGVYTLTNQIVITNALTMQSIAGHGPDDTIVNGGFAPGNPITNRCLLMSNAAVLVAGLTFSNGACIAANSDGGGGVRMYGGVLSNCVVRNSSVFFYSNPTDSGGGGIYMSAGTVTASRVTGNLATNTEAGINLPYAGGIFACRGGAEIIGCTISNNLSMARGPYSYGGGVCLKGATIKSSLLSGNSVSINGDGGNIWMIEKSIANSCTSRLGNAYKGGGCYLGEGIVTNCLFTNDYNYAVYLTGDVASKSRSVVNSTITRTAMLLLNPSGIMIIAYLGTNCVSDCDIINNPAMGIFVDNSSAGAVTFISNCVVRGNTSGGITLRAGATIRNCLISDNLSQGPSWFRGGIYYLGGGYPPYSVSISGCTIVRNQGPAGSLAGSGIRSENTNALSVSSCIIYSNGASISDDAYNSVSPVNDGAIRYSCLGTNSAFTGDRVTTANPQFRNFAGGDFRLTESSPCFNKGSNEVWMLNAVDLGGIKRIFGGTVDMGAYEFTRPGTVFGFR